MVSVWAAQDYESSSALAEVQVSRGDQFVPTWRFLNAEGQLEIVSSDIVLTFGSEPFSFDFFPANSGEYVLTMFVEDMAGNTSVDSASITVDNEGLDTSYRGFKDITFGINFLYPWNWSDPAVIEDGEGGVSLAVSDENGDHSILIDGYEVGSVDDVRDIALENAQAWDDVELYEPEFYEVAGYDAYIVEYEYQSETGPAAGVMLAIYVPENGLGYVIDVDGPAGTEDTIYELFNVVMDSLSFFEPVEAPE